MRKLSMQFQAVLTAWSALIFLKTGFDQYARPLNPCQGFIQDLQTRLLRQRDNLTGGLLIAGINQWEGSQIPKYVSNTNLSSRVGQLNPDWNSPLKSDADLDTQFYKAMDLAGSEFVEKVTWLTRVSVQSVTPFRDCICHIYRL